MTSGIVLKTKQETIQKHIPTKLIGNKSRLPWVNYQLKNLINKKNKLYKKKKQNIKHSKAYQKVKAQLQKEMRNAYWKYIENMIFDIEIQEPGQQRFNKQPKNLYSYIKSQKSENTCIAPLRSEGTLHTDPSDKGNNSNPLSPRRQTQRYQTKVQAHTLKWKNSKFTETVSTNL